MLEVSNNLCGEVLTQFGSDKDQAHSYGPVYERMFRARRLEPLSILEVGILNGNSLRAWESYFPNSTIIGIDSNNDLCQQFNTVAKISRDRGERKNAAIAVACDSTKSVADLFGSMFDIVIDDGSHWKDDQAATINNLWPFLVPGGTYVIEDVQHLAWADELASLRPGGRVIDLRAWKGRFDDILVVWEGGVTSV